MTASGVREETRTLTESSNMNLSLFISSCLEYYGGARTTPSPVETREYVVRGVDFYLGHQNVSILEKSDLSTVLGSVHPRKTLDDSATTVAAFWRGRRVSRRYDLIRRARRSFKHVLRPNEALVHASIVKYTPAPTDARKWGVPACGPHPAIVAPGATVSVMVLTSKRIVLIDPSNHTCVDAARLSESLLLSSIFRVKNADSRFVVGGKVFDELLDDAGGLAWMKHFKRAFSGIRRAPEASDAFEMSATLRLRSETRKSISRKEIVVIRDSDLFFVRLNRFSKRVDVRRVELTALCDAGARLVVPQLRRTSSIESFSDLLHLAPYSSFSSSTSTSSSSSYVSLEAKRKRTARNEEFFSKAKHETRSKKWESTLQLVTPDGVVSIRLSSKAKRDSFLESVEFEINRQIIDACCWFVPARAFDERAVKRLDARRRRPFRPRDWPTTLAYEEARKWLS